jgi:hypothetical protein
MKLHQNKQLYPPLKSTLTQKPGEGAPAHPYFSRTPAVEDPELLGTGDSANSGIGDSEPVGEIPFFVPHFQLLTLNIRLPPVTAMKYRSP